MRRQMVTTMYNNKKYMSFPAKLERNFIWVYKVIIKAKYQVQFALLEDVPNLVKERSFGFDKRLT